MLKYIKASLIRCNIDELYDFHLNTENLVSITPSNMKVEILNQNFVPKQGEILKLRTIKNFIPMQWNVEINTLERPSLLVDVALKSPFKFWKHSHVFTQKEDGYCELKDIIEYTLPLTFLNAMLKNFITSELNSMFSYRHTTTKKILERGNIIL